MSFYYSFSPVIFKPYELINSFPITIPLEIIKTIYIYKYYIELYLRKKSLQYIWIDYMLQRRYIRLILFEYMEMERWDINRGDVIRYYTKNTPSNATTMLILPRESTYHYASEIKEYIKKKVSIVPPYLVIVYIQNLIVKI